MSEELLQRVESVHSVFLDVADRFSDRLAISEHLGDWTYEDVERASRCVMLALRRNGLKRGEVVIVDSDRCAMLPIALIAVLRLGATFFIRGENEPLRYTKRVLGTLSNLHWLCMRSEDVQRRALQREFGDALASYANLYMSLAAVRVSRPEPAVELDALPACSEPHMYLASTSGSTGTPKLVAGGHEPVLHFVRWYQRKFAIDCEDRVSLLSGLGYDPLLRDIFTPLLCGGTLCIPRPSEVLGRTSLADWLARADVTVAHMTPSLANVIFKSGAHALLEKMRLIGIGGSVLTHEMLGRVREAAPRSRVLNFYGTTEVPQVTTFYDTSEVGGGDTGDLPIGTPVDEFDVIIRDDAGEPCAPGVTGEICVRSHHLTEGYLRRDGESIRPLSDPVTHQGIRPEYHTGDLGWFDADGQLMFAGRKNRQIKSRGNRVQPEEVERAIADCAGVRHVAVVAAPTSNGDWRLICYVEVAGDSGAVLRGIKEHLSDDLPSWLLPEVFHVIPSMPMTARGKIDYEALRPPEPSGPRSSTQATTRIQARVLRVWSEVLDVSTESLCAQSNFFDVGGDSLAAGRLIEALQMTFGRALRITDIFLYPSIQDMASFLSSEDSGVDASRGHRQRSNNRQNRIAMVRARRMRSRS